MNTWLNRAVIIVTAAFFLSEVSIASTLSADNASSSWKFRVMLDDKPIGYHRVSVNREDNGKVVHTQANFDVRILFIPVYSYEHETRERWKDNCLVNINSTTDDNGDDYFIKGIQSQEILKLETRDGVTSLDGCVRTFAYWDIELLQSERLLNTQTGKYETVSLTDMGVADFTIDDEQIEARLFRLVSENTTIDLWYSREMRWLALESETDSGAVLRYLPDTYADVELDARS